MEQSVNHTGFDAVALGEVMLRLDPGAMRIRTARAFDVWEGGGEYNVARGLARVFGLRTAVVTSLVDDEVGHLIESMMQAGGVDTSNIVWVASDGVGREVSNGLNFTERGFGVRGSKGVSYRGHTAISRLTAADVDFDGLFGRIGVRCLHTGGIYAALSPTSAETALAAVASAHKHDTLVSYDLNYRPSLWKAVGGQERARAINDKLVSQVDVLFGNEEDLTAALGFEIGGVDANLVDLPTASFAAAVERVAQRYPNLQVIATTLRSVRSASVNDWGAIAWSRATGVVQATQRNELEIFDRVGGGDSFAAGLLYGLLTGESLQRCVDLGAAHGALAMTTPGDTSMATKEEVAKLADGGGARVDR